jgi:4-amino-4-deoxy-L-arabinose transferase-like glycosyltransferase
MPGTFASDIETGVDRASGGDRLAGLGLAGLVAWLLLQAVLHAIAAPAPGLDEAEILVTSQVLSLGDGAQPPLYVWLYTAVSSLFGISILTLAVFKHALLALAFVFFYLASRLVLAEPLRALGATIALFLFPQVAWEVQRTLSHSVLALCLGCAALYLFLRLLRDGKVADYVLFGLAVGLGLLSKYNFAVLALALLLAALLYPAWRTRVLTWRSLLAAAVVCLIVGPHALWALSNPDLVLSEAATFGIEHAATLLERIWRPLSATLIALVGFAVVPIVVLGAAAAVPPLRSADAPMALGSGRFVVVLTMVTLALVLAMALGTGATTMRDRWLLPVLFFLPLSLVAVWSRWLSPRRLVIVGTIGVALSVISAAAIFATTVRPDLMGKPVQGTEPFRAFAAAIVDRHGSPSHIIADATNLGGQLRLVFPEATVSVPSYPLAPAVEHEAVLIAWKGRGAMPETIREEAVVFCGAEAVGAAQSDTLTEPYVGSVTYSYDLSYAWIPECNVPAALIWR